MGPKVVRIEGVKVVAEQAGLRFAIFELLWRDFLAHLLDGASLDTFPARPISHITREMERRTERQYPDETTVRRAVNRLQADIEETVKKRLGLPIDRDDIVQTVRWSAQADENFGYRINPFTVAARPYQADLG